MTKEQNKLCNIYVRVSTEEQAKQGYSISSQIKTCSEFAKEEGYKISEVFVDEGLSAKDLNRPELQKLMLHSTEKKNCIDAVIVWQIDRLSRNTEDYYSIIKPFLTKNNIKLLSVTQGYDDNPTGDFMRNLHIMLAEYERNLIGMRVNAGMKAKAEKGIYPSRAPIGYKNIEDKTGEKIVIIDESKALFIRKAFEMYATGSYSVEEIREQLKEDGFRAKTLPVTKKGIYTILKNPFYIGSFIWQGVQYEKGKHKPIISKELFYKVQSVFENKGRPRKQKREFAFTGLIKCECGCYLTAETKKERLTYYKCTGNKGCTCKKKYIREEKIEKLYQEIFDSINLPECLAEEIEEEIKKIYKIRSKSDSLSVEALSKEIPKIEKKINQMYEDKLEGTITSDFFTIKHAEYRIQIEKLKIQIDNKMKTSEDRFSFSQNLIELCKNASTLFKNASKRKKKMMINLVQSNALLKDEKLLVELKPIFNELTKNANSDKWYPQGNSNPCLHRERVMS